MIDPADWAPLEPDDHERQLGALLARLDTLGRPARIIDIGAGGGRIAAPLAEAGHDVLAIDIDPDAVAACQDAGINARRADALDRDADLSHHAGPADCALCLGNTFALIDDVHAAAAMLTRLRPAVAPGGWFATDAVSFLWEEVAEGNWQRGDSEDGAWRLAWATGDPVIAVRAIDDAEDSDAIDAWDIREGDTPCRLWSLGALRLLALASGWGEPAEHTDQHLTVFMRPLAG